MNVETHRRLNPALCGAPGALGTGTAEVLLHTTADMAADDEGLVHGGFVFGAADHAAMLAVNHPLVVLASASCTFTAPVRVGETVRCTAERTAIDGRKHHVRVVATVDDRTVFTAEFLAAVPSRHVLAPRP
jgi:acyl-coenzyme A thioesterase PaaI-like protein